MSDEMLETFPMTIMSKYCSKVEMKSTISTGDVLTQVEHNIHERGSF